MDFKAAPAVHGPLFQSDRLLSALCALQRVVHPTHRAPPMSDDCVAFFNHLLSRICSEVVLRVAAGETFGAAVNTIFDSELARCAIRDAEKWDAANSLEQMVSLFENVDWPAGLKSQVCGLAEYTLAEIVDVTINTLRDDGGRVLSDCCQHDLRLLFQMTADARNEAAPASEEVVQDLLRRYQQLPLVLVGRGIFGDKELGQLCRRALGEEMHQWIPVPKQQPDFASVDEFRTRCTQWREDERACADAWLFNGPGVKQRQIGTAFPSPQQLGALKMFCLQYDAVDQNGLREVETSDADDDGGGCYAPEVSAQLALVRHAARGDCDDAGVVTLHLEEHYHQGGCHLLQLFGAVAFQVAAGNISKVSFVWSSEGEESIDLATFAEEILGDTFDHACYPKPTYDHYTVDMYGESLTESYTGDTVLHKLAYLNNVKHLRKIGPRYNVEDSISACDSGLHDEDSLGQYKPVHVAAHEGHLEVLCVLVDELNANIDSRAFDNCTPLIVAVSRGHIHIVEACVERHAKLNTKIVEEPGWQGNMMSTAGFSAVHMAVNCGQGKILEHLLEAGAAASLCTGPLDIAAFPIDFARMTEVHEYCGDGHRYTALHLASLLANPFAVSALLTGGNKDCNRADVDERVKSGFCGDVEDNFTTRSADQVQLSMSTAMHLAKSESVVVATLAHAGANLLAQNFQLEIAGERLSPVQLGQWVWSQAQGRETALLLQRKQMPPRIEYCILQHVVELHLMEQFDEAMNVELQPCHAPFMAAGLVSDEQWEIESETIIKHVAASNCYASWFVSPTVPQQEQANFLLWVRGLLKVSKQAKLAELSARIMERIKLTRVPVASSRSGLEA